MKSLRYLLNRYFSAEERTHLIRYYAVVAAAHLIGWGLVIWLSTRHPTLLGLGALAYGFGIRHAFDADHISAVDNVTRKLVHSGKDPLGTGFFFSLGHSTVVFFVAIILGVSAQYAIRGVTAHLARVGGVLGTGISGFSLLAIGFVNLLIFVDLYRRYRGRRDLQNEPTERASNDGRLSADGQPEVGLPSGILFRLFGRLFRFVKSSKQMYFVGFFFGLGFDTASEVALLAISAVAGSQGWSILAVVSLPVLFAAGMSLMDTSDAVLMSKAYSWSADNPLRGSFYNLLVTGLSVGIALTVGGIELLRVFTPFAGAAWWPGRLMKHVGSWAVGVTVVAVFAAVWVTAAIVLGRRRGKLTGSTLRS